MSKAYWAVIPAAGIGSRMQSEIPKQYLRLGEKTIIEHTLDRFLTHPLIKGVVVAISSDDQWWPNIQFSSDKPIITVEGGAERCHSVLAALRRLSEFAKPDDWALVHDAARPCLRAEDISRLIDQLKDHPVGGLLAVPVRDTMKRQVAGSHSEVAETVEREGLWHALTPQMFPIKSLKFAVESAIVQGVMVTDEAQSMERLANKPLLVEGHADNIKVTRPQDLSLAELYTHNQ